MKKYIRRLFPIIYVGVALYCLLMVIKPGSSIFYIKSAIRSEEIIPHRGKSYRYLMRVKPLMSPSEGVLLFEDGHLLKRISTFKVVEHGGGGFSLGDPSSQTYYLTFSATDNSDPRSNGKTYTIYQPTVFLSRRMGLIYMEFMLLGAAWFGVFALKSSAHRRTIKESFASLFQIFDDFIEREVAGPFSPITRPQTLIKSKWVVWKRLLSLIIGAAYFYVFLEWLFFVTKPSFMDLMGWGDKLEILVMAGLELAFIGGALLFVYVCVDILISRTRFVTLPVTIAAFIPSIIFAAISLLMVDNFTYTVFNFGIVTASGGWRGVYGLGFLLVFYYINTKVLEVLGVEGRLKLQDSALRIPYSVTASLLAISLFVAMFQFITGYFRNNGDLANLQSKSAQSVRRPNILLIGGDGLNAANLSVYGYTRDTTPTIRKLAQNSLLADNAFSNSAHSAGSVISILTSKPPTETRVLYPPDILKGSDAYQHLPGILKKMGYHTVEIGVSHYVDAFNMNLLDGFDIVNESSFEEGKFVRFVRKLGYSDSIYFVSRSIERVTDRILHIFFIKEMENPYTIVTQSISEQTDQKRIKMLKEIIRYTDKPLFVHVHMMDTHGSKFFPKQQVFSKGKTQNETWMTDFYDDSILNFDRYIDDLLETLKETDKLDETILIIYSDHAQKYDVRVRIPLLIHFPGDEHAGRIQYNVQNLDIAPTILDYLELAQPEWMEGQSLLRGNLPEHRLTFSGGTSLTKNMGEGKRVVDSERVKPPFYQFTFLNVVDCSNWYQLDLLDFELTSGKVAGHSSPCDDSSMLTLKRAKAELYKHLSINGFDISMLP